jgi:hypothetical protein
MDYALIDAAPYEATYSSPGFAPPPPRRALAGDWDSVADRPWQQILDETIVELAWSAGNEELDALIEAVLVCATDRQRCLSVRTLAQWIGATLDADREFFQRYMHDQTISARQRAALACDLGESNKRIERLVSALVPAAAGTVPEAPAATVIGAPAAGARGSALVLDNPDPASIEMALRAQASIIERRLSELAVQMARLDRAGSRPALVRAAPHAL